ncbi:MAG: peptidylprolyl isomerase [Bacteroidales bacterium]|nr:peptidylprolyl isomerase [Bacteroidales bacterium]
MKKVNLLPVLVLVFIVMVSACSKDDNSVDNPDNNPVDTVQKYDTYKIQTNYGDILIWLYDETPLHKHNFDSLTKAGFYDDLIFHRVINDFVIQGGDPLGNGTGGPGYTIAAEFVSSITHVVGAVGAARNNNPQKRSNGSQFYIVENPNGAHNLDGEYTVFAITIDGMDIVSTIAEVPTNANDKPLTDVVMTKVEVVKYTAEELLTNFGFTVP